MDAQMQEAMKDPKVRASIDNQFRQQMRANQSFMCKLEIRSGSFIRKNITSIGKIGATPL